MERMIVWSRSSRRLKRVNFAEENTLMDAFTCDAEIRAFTICCPDCGAIHEIRASEREPRAFDRRRQRFRCPRCRFVAYVHVVIDFELPRKHAQPAPAK